MSKGQSDLDPTTDWFTVFGASLLCGLIGFIVASIGYLYLAGIAFSGILNGKFVDDRFWLRCSEAVIGLGFAVFPFATLHRQVSSACCKRAALAGSLTAALLATGVFVIFSFWNQFSETSVREIVGPLLLVTALAGVATSTKILLRRIHPKSREAGKPT